MFLSCHHLNLDRDMINIYDLIRGCYRKKLSYDQLYSMTIGYRFQNNNQVKEIDDTMKIKADTTNPLRNCLIFEIKDPENKFKPVKISLDLSDITYYIGLDGFVKNLNLTDDQVALFLSSIPEENTNVRYSENLLEKVLNINIISHIWYLYPTLSDHPFLKYLADQVQKVINSFKSVCEDEIRRVAQEREKELPGIKYEIVEIPNSGYITVYKDEEHTNNRICIHVQDLIHILEIVPDDLIDEIQHPTFKNIISSNHLIDVLGWYPIIKMNIKPHKKFDEIFSFLIKRDKPTGAMYKKLCPKDSPIIRQLHTTKYKQDITTCLSQFGVYVDLDSFLQNLNLMSRKQEIINDWRFCLTWVSDKDNEKYFVHHHLLEYLFDLYAVDFDSVSDKNMQYRFQYMKDLYSLIIKYKEDNWKQLNSVQKSSMPATETDTSVTSEVCYYYANKAFDFEVHIIRVLGAEDQIFIGITDVFNTLKIEESKRKILLNKYGKDFIFSEKINDMVIHADNLLKLFALDELPVFYQVRDNLVNYLKLITDIINRFKLIIQTSTTNNKKNNVVTNKKVIPFGSKDELAPINLYYDEDDQIWILETQLCDYLELYKSHESHHAFLTSLPLGYVKQYDIGCLIKYDEKTIDTIKKFANNNNNVDLLLNNIDNEIKKFIQSHQIQNDSTSAKKQADTTDEELADNLESVSDNSNDYVDDEVTPTELAIRYGMRLEEFNDVLYRFGLQYSIEDKRGKEHWILRSKYVDQGLVEDCKFMQIRNEKNELHIIQEIKSFTSKGAKFIHDILTRQSLK